MNTSLNTLKEAVTALKDIAEHLVDLKDLVLKHLKFFSFVLLLVISYFVLRYYAYHYPGNSIKAYYKAIGNQRFEDAWHELDESYTSRRWRDSKEFAQLYANSTPYNNLAINYLGTKVNPIKGLICNTLKYEVSFEVYERFTREDLEQPGQLENRLWVNIYHKRDFPRLMDGTIGQDEFGSNPSLALRRYFKQVILLHKAEKDWKISSIHTIERGLKPLQSKDS